MVLIPVVSKFNFYQQIRLLLRRLRRRHTMDEILLNEALQIVSTLSLETPVGEVENLQQDNSDAPIRVTTGHNGLTGALGALPTTYNEWLIERQYRYSDQSAKAFFDIFGHRLYCLDYLAWQKHHLYALSESESQPPLHILMLALSGLLTSTPSQAMMRHAPLFASPVRSMVTLERWLSAVVRVPVQIIPFTGGWRSAPEPECCQLGNPALTLMSAPMLGRVRLENHAHFDVVLGPVSPEVSQRFIPPGTDWKEVWLHVRDYVGPVMEFTVYLIISAIGSVPKPLGKGVLGLDLYLGHNSESYLHKVRLPSPDTTF